MRHDRGMASGTVALVLLAVSLLGCSAREQPVGAAGVDASATSDPSDAGHPFETCATHVMEAEPLPGSLLFQVDTSGSMNCPADGAPDCLDAEPTEDADDSRFDVFRVALLAAVDSLPGASRVGLMHYPLGLQCASGTPDVPLQPVDTGAAAITAALGSIAPDGITPTHDAVRYGLGELARSSDPERFLVLATDGAATVCEGCDAACSFEEQAADDEAMLDEIADAAASGIRTFVIGSPGSERYRSVLSRMARAGGTPRGECSDTGPTRCHYDLTDPSLVFAEALQTALAEITRAALPCDYEIPTDDPAVDPHRVNIRLTDGEGRTETIPRDPGQSDGWDYSPDRTRIVLHGPACDRARSTSEARIDIVFGCQTVLI